MAEERVPISKRLVVINAASSIITRLANLAVAVWVIQHLVKRIDPAEYELLPIIMSVVAFIVLFNTVFASGIARYVTEALARDDSAGATRIVSSMVPATFAAGAALAGLTVLLALHVDHVLDIDPAFLADARIMAVLMMASTIVNLILSPFLVGLHAHQRYVLLNSTILAMTLLRVALLLGLILGLGPRVLWVAVANCAAGVIGQIIHCVLSMRLVPELRFRIRAFDLATMRELVGFGAWMSLGKLGSTIRNMIDPLILNWFASPVSVTGFSIGGMVDVQLRHMTITAGAPMLPALTAMHAQGRADRLRNAFFRGGRIITWLAMTAATPLIVFHEPVMRLYLGHTYMTYEAAAIVMRILLLAIVFSYPMTMLIKIAHATARVGQVTRVTITSQVLNVALAIYLVKVVGWGAVGAAFSTFCIGVIFALLVMPRVACNLLGVTHRQILIQHYPRAAGPFFLALPVGLAINYLLEPRSWLVVGACCIAIAALHAGLAYFLFAVPADRADVRRMLRTVTGRLRPRRPPDIPS
jgi:O-antigen/teichoic acid export membrane protein